MRDGGLDASKLNQNLPAIQTRLRGPAPRQELVVMDGKEPRHGSGASIHTAVTVPSQHYLGCAIVDQKTNDLMAEQHRAKALRFVLAKRPSLKTLS